MKFKEKENPKIIYNIRPYPTEKGWKIKLETQNNKGYEMVVSFRMPMPKFEDKIFSSEEEAEEFIKSLAE